MKQQQSGFTLIELVMVIVILGILAATALPKFIDLKSDANRAATQGVAGALSSAYAINYAARSANSSNTSTVAVSACNSGLTGGTLILQGGLPSGYTADTAAVTAGGATNCVLSSTASSTTVTATYTALGIL